MEINLDMSAVDRMHRVGKKFVKNSKSYQSIIIKFKSWMSRAEFYKSRPKVYDINGKRKPGNPYSISPDLTKRRYELLKQAKELIGHHNNVSFAFADINCALGIKTTNNKFIFFNNNDQLDKILADL